MSLNNDDGDEDVIAIVMMIKFKKLPPLTEYLVCAR